MAVVGEEIRTAIERDVEALFDMYVSYHEEHDDAEALRLARAGMIVGAIYRQSVEYAWPFDIDERLAIRGLQTQFSRMNNRQRMVVGNTAFTDTMRFTQKARTIPQEVSMIREGIYTSLFVG